MNKIIITLFTLTLSFIGMSQDLAFEEFGSEPAYCRLYGYQSGNGVVYASAFGGTPSYTYEWENLGTGETTTNATWGALNPGDYQCTVTDAMGATISQTLTLDSLNVIADFHAFSDVLSEIPDGYIGFAPDTIGFINLSENCENPYNPDSDPRYFWNFDYPDADYDIIHTLDTQYKGYLFGGEYEVSLTARNKNGCADTIIKTIGLFGSLVGVDEGFASAGLFSITPKSSTGEIIIDKSGNDENLLLNLYSVSGQIIHTTEILNPSTSIPFNFERGIYLYEFADKNGQIIATGKFNY